MTKRTVLRDLQETPFQKNGQEGGRRRGWRPSPSASAALAPMTTPAELETLSEIALVAAMRVERDQDEAHAPNPIHISPALTAAVRHMCQGKVAAKYQRALGRAPPHSSNGVAFQALYAAAKPVREAFGASIPSFSKYPPTSRRGGGTRVGAVERY